MVHNIYGLRAIKLQLLNITFDVCQTWWYRKLLSSRIAFKGMIYKLPPSWALNPIPWIGGPLYAPKLLMLLIESLSWSASVRQQTSHNLSSPVLGTKLLKGSFHRYHCTCYCASLKVLSNALFCLICKKIYCKRFGHCQRNKHRLVRQPTPVAWFHCGLLQVANQKMYITIINLKIQYSIKKYKFELNSKN